MVYMSPEMALAPSFQKLWKYSCFWMWITAIVVDEAHCIAEWGSEDFQPTYRLLETLCGYTGQEIPIIACTATYPTKTFDLIWTTLGYGFHPFWGLNIGFDWPNLLYITWILENPKNSLLNIIKLPQWLDCWACWTPFWNAYSILILRMPATKQFSLFANAFQITSTGVFTHSHQTCLSLKSCGAGNSFQMGDITLYVQQMLLEWDVMFQMFPGDKLLM